jgi:hypothetical protein
MASYSVNIRMDDDSSTGTATARRKDGVGEAVAVPFTGWKEMKEAAFWALRTARELNNEYRSQAGVRVERPEHLLTASHP